MRIATSLAVVLLLGAVVGLAEASAETNAAPEESVYLFTSFRENGEDGLRFLSSSDGYEWTEVPGTFLRPRLGKRQLMRDPSLVRTPEGTYHLVWTTGWQDDQGFGHASSKDLVHWSEQKFIPVMEHEPTTVNVWAPEIFYDEPAERYIICWASTIPGRFPDHLEPHENNQRMYYTTTRDFKTFTPTKLFLEPDFSVIDATIVKYGDRYVLILKDNTRPVHKLRVAFSDSPLGPWRDVSETFTPEFTEGPTVLKVGDDWLIYFDAYRAEYYGAVKTRDFKTYADVTDRVSFPKGHKHGTVLQVPRKDLDYLLKVGPQQVSGVRHPWVSPLSEAEVAERLEAIDEVAHRGPFKPDWDSLGHFKTPEWYRDAKFGLFIHWGAYSVPAFGSEWYPRNMYRTGSPEFEHHVATYGPQSQFGYKDLIAQFKAEEFDAARWAKLFKDAGVRYVIPVAEHHDGFPMYDSDVTEWSAAKQGPRRDVISQLAEALRAEGIVFGASSHRAEHWWFFDQGMYIDSDVRDEKNAALYGPAANQRMAENQSEPPDQAFLDDWLIRSCEIVDKYQPEVVYFDWWICQPVFQPYLKRFAAYYYNRGAEWNKEVAINFKEWEGRSFPDGTGVFDIERGQSADIRPDFWQTCTSVSKNSWGYVTNHEYKDVGDVVDDLIDIVSKNGTMLLNIGPKDDGTIPEQEQQMLLVIGGWLKVNGEAIYGTRPWKKFGEGPTQIVAGSFADVKRQPFTGQDFRFTTKGDTLYAIALAWPDNGKLVVKSLALSATASPPRSGEGLGEGSGATGSASGIAADTGEASGTRITDVRLLGHDGKLQWEQTDEGLVVTLPDNPPSEFAVTLAIRGIDLNAKGVP
jgi:alpha-L-fucosidase